jgi:uncharacterized membrane protein
MTRPPAVPLVPLGLVALSVIPLTAGALRLLQLAGGPDVMPADSRFPAFPVALLVHILGAAVYVLLGVLQLVPTFRRTHLAWHRRAGRVLVAAGLLVAGSALWMTLGYTRKPGTGDVLFALRLLFASAMVVALVLGVRAARRRRFAAHRAWMVRAYAIALAAGTQALTEGVGTAIFGTGDLTGDLSKGAGWVLNLAVAEWAIRRPSSLDGRYRSRSASMPSSTTWRPVSNSRP